MKALEIDNAYKIDAFGTVYSCLFNKTKVMKTSLDISGNYHRVTLRNGKAYLVHRLVAMTYIPNPDNLPQVNHKDGDMQNNHKDNLEWVTIGDNQRHAYDTGLKARPKGTLNGRQELSEDQVISIYNKALDGYSNKILSDIFGVTTTQIGRIKSKAAWSHITSHLPDIKIRQKAVPLQQDQTSELESLILDGGSFKDVSALVSFIFTKDQFYRIKGYLLKS